jgi:predicted dinucleotide-binding enzyme
MERAISRRLVDGGHSVFLANSNPDKAKAVAEEITWLGHLGRITAVSVSDAVQRGEVVILATWCSVSRQLAPEFADMFGKRVVIDVSNPLNETFDGLVSDSSTSAVEELRRRAPKGRWVKAFNTVFAPVLFEGHLGGAGLDIFIASDDTEAKKKVFEMVNPSGMRALDAGPLKNSRTLERMMLLWIQMQGRYGLSFRAGCKLMPSRQPAA